MWSRAPGGRDIIANKWFFVAADEALIGATYYLAEIDRFGFVLLARDEFGRYRAFDNQGPFTSARAADAAIIARLIALEAGKPFILKADPTDRPGVDLFAPIPKAKLNPKFANLRDGRNPSAARELLKEIARWVVDLDGNLVRDFQTTGFDARTWELYLFTVFTALDFGFDRSAAVPDFRLKKGDAKLFVEAVTANPTGSTEAAIAGPPPLPPDDFWSYIENEMPQKFGSPLLSKIRKAYWQREDVADHPFVIAIADFHAPASMIWSHTALPLYLYGIGVDIHHALDGRIFGTLKKLDRHVVGDKVVPTNFFAQESTRHVSAILFSNAGTMAKFNRMGVLAGFGDPEVSLIRKGGLNDPNPGAFDAVPFEINIESPDYTESWADEIEIYHNPNALVPLPETLLPTVTHFKLEGGELVWRGPSPRVLYSMTQSIAHKGPAPEETVEE